MLGEFQVHGGIDAAPFSLTLHRGEGMTLLGMNWRGSKPPQEFVGFAIEYREPGGDRFYALKNRLGFTPKEGTVDPNSLSTRLSPIQKFRWVHFPRHADLSGEFTYRVTPVFMNALDELSYGEAQTANIELRRETYPKKLNVTFTRGFVSSQAFVDRYEAAGGIATLLPAKADEGLTFKPTHPKADEALAWMGFEAREAILNVLDQAIEDKKAKVMVVAYDLNESAIVARLKQLGSRLRIIIDDDGAHKTAHSSESKVAAMLASPAVGASVKRQHLGQLQHNKTIVVNGPKAKLAVCGSTNFTWRGLYVQANNAIVVRGKKAIAPFVDAFENYWIGDGAAAFGKTSSARWTKLAIASVNANVSFSPHSKSNALLASIAADVENHTSSSLFYSLAFLYQTPGPLRRAIERVSKQAGRFVYGISDRKVGGLDLQMPNGNVAAVYPQALASTSLPEPFKSEPTGGSGVRLHHKFLVVDFDKPTARVYLGSYNFSETADRKNGENLVLIRDRRIAVSYMIEALRIFDHYHFRVAVTKAKKATSAKKRILALKRPPRKQGEKPWWSEYYSDPRKIRDREIFS